MRAPAEIERGVEQPRRRARAPARSSCRAGLCALRLDDQRQAVEKLAHAGRQRGRQLVERRRDVLLEGRGGEAFDQRAAEIQRAQLREREAGVVEPPERPARASSSVCRRSTSSNSGKPAVCSASRSRRMVRVVTPVRDARSSMVSAARRFEVAQDGPLTNDFGVARHLFGPWDPAARRVT